MKRDHLKHVIEWCKNESNMPLFYAIMLQYLCLKTSFFFIYLILRNFSLSRTCILTYYITNKNLFFLQSNSFRI
jgi:hypothetical protein